MEKQKDVVVFDLDDVIVKDAFLRVLEKFLDTKLDPTQFSTYYFEKEIITDSRKLRDFYNYFLTVNMYDYGVIEKGAIELLKRLNQTHEVFICTTCGLREKMNESGILYKNKYEYLCKAFPFLDPNNFILGSNKSIISSKYIVDDKVENLSGNSEIKVLYTAPHNKELSDKYLYDRGIFRISDMNELEKCIYGVYTCEEMIKITSDFLLSIFNRKDLVCEEIRTYMESRNKLKRSKVTISNRDKFINEQEAKLFETFLKKRFGQDKLFIEQV